MRKVSWGFSLRRAIAECNTLLSGTPNYLVTANGTCQQMDKGYVMMLTPVTKGLMGLTSTAATSHLDLCLLLNIPGSPSLGEV